MAINHYRLIYTVHSVLWRNKMDRHSRIDLPFDSRQYGRYRWYRCYDDVYWLRHPLAAHAG